MILNRDYRDMLCALCAEDVKFLLVGAYAMAVHGYVRATADIDIWIMPSPENAKAVLRALSRFGAPLGDLPQQDLEKEGMIFQIGVAPCRIDILTAASGLEFESTFSRAIPVDIDGVQVRIPAIEDLILNKKTTGRTKDLADAEALEGLRGSE